MLPAVLMSRWSVLRPGTARRWSSPTGPTPAPGPAPGPTRRGCVDRDDNDPKRLWASVVAALAACPSVPPGSRLHAPWVWRPGTQPEFLAELCDTVQELPRPVRLILDDVHELLDPVALHGLHTLIRNRPTGFQLVLSSRFDPPLSLSRLRLAGRLWELRADRLRFSPTDAAALLQRSGLDLTPTQVDTLHQRTGGWAAGLRLAAVALHRTTDRDAFLDQFSGNDSSVADYLTGEILSALPDDIQELLRMISISNPVPSGLAAQLSGRQDAGSLLDRLAHHTALLTPTGQHRDTYHIQELLRTYLTADLHRQGPTRVADLHTTAARWWAHQNQPAHALDHATRSHNPTLLPSCCAASPYHCSSPATTPHYAARSPTWAPTPPPPTPG